MISSGDSQTPKQADLLYLVYQYFKTVPGFTASADALRNDLVRGPPPSFITPMSNF
jgi:hypothetical protein